MIKFILLSAFILVSINSRAQSYSKEELEKTKQLARELIGYYSKSDEKFLDFLAPRFSFDDYTVGIKIKSVEEAKQVLKMDRGVTDWKVSVEKIEVLSPQLAIIYGTQTGYRKSIPFKTLFISTLVFNKTSKLVHWTDTVDPQSFNGGSPSASADRELIRSFYKNAYSKLDPTRLSDFLHPKLKLVDHTMNLNYTGIDTIRYVWTNSAKLFDMKKSKIELKKLNPIAKDVLEARGYFNGYKKDGGRIRSPFSSVFILKEGKIFRWIDHVDVNSFK